ncbi:MAG TPA: single-stranded DNA-binding protein [Opitutae bacterium]|nr:single-stranded DNA-binding protein [Opitutae bacterium]
MNRSQSLISASQKLSKQVSGMKFSEPTAYVYNPLDYAWAIHQSYLELAGKSKKKVVFLGMNPGPFGMAQTGVPFGEIPSVRDWMGLRGEVSKPSPEHEKRPVEGLNCQKSEVSGRRLWGLFAERFESAEAFFEDHFVANYCPLVFMEDSGRNRTPDKLPSEERKDLEKVCDQHLRELVEILEPSWLVGVGGFARKRAEEALDTMDIKIGTILHPSPASPAANRGWAEAATKQMLEQNIW